jgi:hypothetical protein
MWLLKPKPPRARRVCKFCAGPFGLVRPHAPFCSAYCEAWYKQPPDQLEAVLPKPPDTMPSN